MSAEVTRLLEVLRGSPDATADVTARLTELLYPELKRIARGLMQRERPQHTLPPTAVLHEAYMRLAGGRQPADWNDRTHFLGIATRVMRQVLVDYARQRHTSKRGSDGVRVTLDEAMQAGGEPAVEVLDLDRALTRYAAIDARGAHVATLRVFGGLTVPEVAEHLAVSTRTVEGDWAVARMWLARELSRAAPASGADGH
jgi:RNA polymerase sigma-70 factor (ECF subfamily)